jgi:hypothetical protein
VLFNGGMQRTVPSEVKRARLAPFTTSAPRVSALLAITAASVTLAAPALATETVVEAFESAGAPAPWRFSNGAEFPGAAGSLTAGAGHAGKGAHLAYDFSGGGHYVSATRTLAAPMAATALGIWVKAPAGIHAKLRVLDATNQTFQYDTPRPLDALNSSDWYRQVVDLAAPTSHFGGANDGVLHQPVQALTVLAADPIEPGARGAVDFDDVSLFDSLSISLDPESLPLVAAPSSASLASRLAVNIHFTQDDRALDIARAAGFTKVRMDLGWGGVERSPGVYDFSAFDRLVSSLSARGMTLHLILDYFNGLYPGPDAANYTSVTVPAFAALSRAAAAHFAGKGATYEVWNEPNLNGFWPPAANAGQYAALCKASIDGVHRGDSAAKVSTAGISSFDVAFLRGYLNAGGGIGADAVGVHPYRQNGGESVSDDLLLLRSIVAQALPPGRPIWDTEWGYSSSWYGAGHDAGPRAVQAQRVARELLSAWALDFPLIVYYDIRDDGTDPGNAEHNFGLLQNDYTDKPAAVAVRTLSTLAKGRTLAGSLRVAPSSLHALRLDGSQNFIVALWSDAPGSQLGVTVPVGSSAVNMLGAPLTLAPNGAGLRVTVREADGPVYVTIPRRTQTGCEIERAGHAPSVIWMFAALAAAAMGRATWRTRREA